MRVIQIKKEILAEHNRLRTLLEDVSDLARRVAADDVSREPALREAARELASALVHHMESEEQHLAALSRGGDPYWAHHLNEFKQHHIHQRTLLAHFLERVDNIHTSRRLGEFIQAMATAVVLDMDNEETVLFISESAGTTTVQGA